jgi:hypothetical protein
VCLQDETFSGVQTGLRTWRQENPVQAFYGFLLGTCEIPLVSLVTMPYRHRYEDANPTRTPLLAQAEPLEQGKSGVDSIADMQTTASIGPRLLLNRS